MKVLNKVRTWRIHIGRISGSIIGTIVKHTIHIVLFKVIVTKPARRRKRIVLVTTRWSLVVQSVWRHHVACWRSHSPDSACPSRLQWWFPGVCESCIVVLLAFGASDTEVTGGGSTKSAGSPVCSSIGTEVLGTPGTEIGGGSTKSAGSPVCSSIGTEVLGTPGTEIGGGSTKSAGSPVCSFIGTEVLGTPGTEVGGGSTKSAGSPDCTSITVSAGVSLQLTGAT